MLPIGDENVKGVAVAWVTMVVIALNVLAYLIEINRPEAAIQAFVQAWGVVPREHAMRTNLPPTIPYPYHRNAAPVVSGFFSAGGGQSRWSSRSRLNLF